jgi:pyruvate-formate lyase-activating enzyme
VTEHAYAQPSIRLLVPVHVSRYLYTAEHSLYAGGLYGCVLHCGWRQNLEMQKQKMEIDELRRTVEGLRLSSDSPAVAGQSTRAAILAADPDEE